eukprot:4739449-Prorocentrum_lima.AAC.1
MDSTSVQADEGAGYEAGLGNRMGKRSSCLCTLVPFMDWDDFPNDVRKKLAKSHQAGRHPAP